MPFLEPTELSTSIYGEVIGEVSRNDTPTVQAAIDAAIAEAKGYLSAYDVAAIFNATGTSRNPVLLMYVKDIATWHFIQLANPNIDLEFRQSRYKMAIQWLEKVQNGRTVPDLPYPAEVTTDAPGKNFLKWGSNNKKQQHF
jgi:phage gp36-like protein